MGSAIRYVVPFTQITLDDLPRVGGKNASLGELLSALGSRGVRVPDGFAVTADAFRLHLAQAGIEEQIYRPLEQLDVRNVARLVETGRAIRALIESAPLPHEIAEPILAAYAALSQNYQLDAADVAVRSSATAEDLPTASFAGQLESYLNVHGAENLLQAVRSCMASLFTDRAIVYRVEHGFDHRAVGLSVGVQKMVRSDLAGSGVIFTLDTESGFRDIVLVTSAWGLGESVVQGRVDPDEHWVHKPTLEAGYRSIVRRRLGTKLTKMVYGQNGAPTLTVETPPAERAAFTLDDSEVLELARWSLRIESHYSEHAGRPTPMDIEWAKDGQSGELFILQARPETVHSQRGAKPFEHYVLTTKGRVLARGVSVGAKIGSGKVHIVRSLDELNSFAQGEVLVAEMTDPDWEPVLQRAAAVVTDHGGRTCHAAIVSRELGLPCVVGTLNATQLLEGAGEVTVSAAEGDEGKVYAGRLDFKRETIDPAGLPTPRVPVMLNVGNPERAFELGQLPSAGVGLARVEFIVSAIGIHPMALLHPERIQDENALAAIRERTRHYAKPADFFVERLASGIAQIAAAFYPRPVIVRFSDFKTNEYAGLLGGAGFEPKEANPMIGFRGASRYYDDRYREAFALECAAIRRVRGEMGLINTKLMIPFCRTLREGENVIAELEKNGLVRGQDGLEVWVMCEIPNNVILAAEFSKLFDGFSIGSNDLTQLTLGVDRDSQLLAHVFDERDPGVKKMIELVVRTAHESGRKVGICGQAPSDHPEFAEFLAAIGIDSISVTEDALPRVLRALAIPTPTPRRDIRAPAPH